MDLKQLRAFLTVSETGSVSRAASVLNLVQPAVSRQIRLLEDSMGTPLFARERHGMVLTPAGRTLSEYARRALLELERARAQIVGAGAGVAGLATLGLLPSTIERLAGPLVTEMARRYPGIRLNLAAGYAGTLRRWLESGEIDAALLYGNHHAAGVQATPLLADSLWLVGPPEAGLRAEQPVTMADAARHPLILPGEPHGTRTLVEHACATAKVKLNVVVETNSLSVQRSLALHGHGLTIFPPVAVSDDLRDGRLAGAPLTDPDIPRNLVLALPAHRPPARHVRCAVDVLVAEARRAVLSGAWPQARWLGQQEDRHATQFSTSSAGTRENSDTLFVTSTRPSLRA